MMQMQRFGMFLHLNLYTVKKLGVNKEKDC